MIASPKLSFLPPELFEQAMRVDELDMAQAMQVHPPFKSSRFVVYPGQTSPLDVHSVKECWFIASGKGTLYYNNDSGHEIGPGDVLYFDANISHRVFNSGVADLIVFSVWWG